MRLATLLLAAVLLAGCSSPDPAVPADPPGEPPAAKEDGVLQGVVVDAAIRPLAGVEVRVLELAANTTTAEDGTYRFKGLPADRFLIVFARLDGFANASKQVTLQADGPTTLDFQLEALPSGTPSVDQASFDGFLECQVALMGVGDDQSFDCGTSARTQAVWDVTSQATLAGAVFEVFWEPNAPVFHSLGLTLERVVGDGTTVFLGEIIGEGPLRLTVAKDVATQQLAQGGTIRATVRAAPNGDEVEASVAVAMEFQQSFDLFASLFYVQGPDPTYTIEDT